MFLEFQLYKFGMPMACWDQSPAAIKAEVSKHLRRPWWWLVLMGYSVRPTEQGFTV